MIVQVNYKMLDALQRNSVDAFMQLINKNTVSICVGITAIKSGMGYTSRLIKWSISFKDL